MKIYYGWLLLACFAVTPSAKPIDILNSLSYVGGIALKPNDPLDSVVTLLRVSTKAFYEGKSIFGGKGYEALQKEYLYPPQGAIPSSVLKQLQDYNLIKVVSAGHPNYNNEPGKIVTTTGLGIKEAAFVGRRLAYARKILQTRQKGTTFPSPDTNPKYKNECYGYALETGLKDDAQVPRIATCFSGGGFRAMIATLGFLKGMADIGIDGSILYTANLSGSTWCSMPWAMGASLEQLEETYTRFARVGVGTSTIADMQKYVAPYIKTEYLKKKLTSAFLWEQPLSTVRGIYAPFIAQMTLSTWDQSTIANKNILTFTNPLQSSQYLYLWQALNVIDSGIKRPFPIATALIPYKGDFWKSGSTLAKEQGSQNGLWMEFNPEYVGFEYNDKNKTRKAAYIPSYALGRKFKPKYKNFYSTSASYYEATQAPAHTVDYWAGTWGSAFTVSPKDIWRIVFNKEKADDKSESLGDKLIGIMGSFIDVASQITDYTMPFFKNAKDTRLYPAEFNNFAKFSGSPISADTFVAVDAGIDFNDPLPPLLREARAIDLIIVGDWSQTPVQELVKAEKWARGMNIPFPLIAQSTYMQNKNKNKNVPFDPLILFNEYPDGAKRGVAILYVSLINNPFNAPGFSVDACFEGACSTFNFNYQPDYVQKLSDHTYRTLKGVYPQIREVVQELVIAKNDKKPFTLIKLNASPDKDYLKKIEEKKNKEVTFDKEHIKILEDAKKKIKKEFDTCWEKCNGNRVCQNNCSNNGQIAHLDQAAEIKYEICKKNTADTTCENSYATYKDCYKACSAIKNENKKIHCLCDCAEKYGSLDIALNFSAMSTE